uniref:Uncharacterized protein n=1 Tax=Anguilla anguilla TaxID=7936 RepID=A0A0E9SEF0_ANGAN
MQSSHSCLSSAVQLHCTGQLLYRSQGQFCPAPLLTSLRKVTSDWLHSQGPGCGAGQGAGLWGSLCSSGRL